MHIALFSLKFILNILREYYFMQYTCAENSNLTA